MKTIEWIPIGIENDTDVVTPAFLKEVENHRATIQESIGKVDKSCLKITLPKTIAKHNNAEFISDEILIGVLKDYAKGFTQQVLAKKYHISQSRISNILKGKCSVNPHLFQGSNKISATQRLSEMFKNVVRENISLKLKLKSVKSGAQLLKANAKLRKKIKLVQNNESRRKILIAKLKNKIKALEILVEEKSW